MDFWEGKYYDALAKYQDLAEALGFLIVQGDWEWHEEMCIKAKAMRMNNDSGSYDTSYQVVD